MRFSKNQIPIETTIDVAMKCRWNVHRNHCLRVACIILNLWPPDQIIILVKSKNPQPNHPRNRHFGCWKITLNLQYMRSIYEITIKSTHYTTDHRNHPTWVGETYGTPHKKSPFWVAEAARPWGTVGHRWTPCWRGWISWCTWSPWPPARRISSPGEALLVICWEMSGKIGMISWRFHGDFIHFW